MDGVFTFTLVPGNVKTFRNMPPLRLHHQNVEWHLTHRAVILSIVLTVGVDRRRPPWCRCPTGVPPGCMCPIGVPSCQSVAFLLSFSASSCRQSLPFLLEWFIIPDVIVGVVPVGHVDKGNLSCVPPRPSSDPYLHGIWSLISYRSCWK